MALNLIKILTISLVFCALVYQNDATPESKPTWMDECHTVCTKETTKCYKLSKKIEDSFVCLQAETVCVEACYARHQLSLDNKN